MFSGLDAKLASDIHTFSKTNFRVEGTPKKIFSPKIQNNCFVWAPYFLYSIVLCEKIKEILQN